MHIKQRFAGRFKCLVSKPGQAPYKETDWFDNLITNQGLDSIGNSNPYGPVDFRICPNIGVGTGSTTPAVTDTTLDAFLAAWPVYGQYNPAPSIVNSYVAGSPAYYSSVMTYTYSVGAAAGNLTEIGTGYYTSGDTTFKVFSRALIVDGGGSPTTLTILSDEILTVVYELRCYLDQTDNTYSILINGTDTYGGTYRIADIATAPFLNRSQQEYLGIPTCFVYNGSIGAVTTHPSGTSAGGQNDCSTVSGGYTIGTYFTDFTSSYAVGKGNLSGGITAIMVQSSHGNYQFSVSPAIAKDNTKLFSITYRLSWARYP